MTFGYLDPGTGGLILQAVLGGVAGIALFFRARLHRFRRKKSERDAGSSPTTAPAPHGQRSDK